MDADFWKSWVKKFNFCFSGRPLVGVGFLVVPGLMLLGIKGVGLFFKIALWLVLVFFMIQFTEVRE